MGRPTPASGAARRRIAALGLALTCSLTVGLAAPGQGATDPDQRRKSSVDKQIESTKHALEETSASFQKAYAALEATTAKLPAARSLAARTESARAAADEAEAEAAAALELARANEAKATAQLAATKKQLVSSQRDVAGLAAQMYMQQGMGQLTVALDSASPGEFVDRVALVNQVADLQQGRIDRLATDRASQAAQEAHLSALRVRSDEAQQAAEAALTAATSARDAAASAKASLETLAASQETQASDLKAQEAAERSRLSGLQAESDKLGKILAERARQAKIKAEKERQAREKRLRDEARKKNKPYRPPVDPPRTGFLSKAMPGWAITSEFGMRFHPILHIWRLHSGMDFGAPCGTPVYAAAPGTVIMSGWAGGYGNRVVVDHGIVNGVNLVTTYNHMQRIAKYSGHVSRGQLVGYEGTTGMSTGCHLHFETLVDGRFDNPRNWL